MDSYFAYKWRLFLKSRKRKMPRNFVATVEVKLIVIIDDIFYAELFKLIESEDLLGRYRTNTFILGEDVH